ncbi:MAG: TetR/AcrR family transcriptional regulator [Acidimicrobiia bacterium]
MGTRGAKTRQQIVEAALRCFTERGFHATSVDDIATLAETSRATLYQYFESKEAIFIELMDESGGALSRVTRRLGRLGPHAEGYDNLHWWLGEWSWVFDRYAAMFIEWANVSSAKAPLRPKLIQFVDLHTAKFNAVLESSGYDGEDPTAASLLTLALANRFNYIRHVYRPGLSESVLLGSLATAIQLFLFPDTPAAVLAAGPLSADRTPSGGVRPPIAAIGPLATLPPRNSIERPTRFEGLSPQSARTVRQLVDAAGRVFAASGYDAANIDQIVTEAGLARGTFYRYFSDKLELITMLSDEAASVMSPLFVEFERFAERRDPAELRDWLRRFRAVQQRYAGVMRAWTEGFPIDPRLLAATADVVAAMGSAITATFGPPRPHPLDRRAAGMLLASLLEHFPNEGAGSAHEPSEAQIVETQALFIERVLFPR